MERIFLCALQFVKFSDLGQSVALRSLELHELISNTDLSDGTVLRWKKLTQSQLKNEKET